MHFEKSLIDRNNENTFIGICEGKGLFRYNITLVCFIYVQAYQETMKRKQVFNQSK